MRKMIWCGMLGAMIGSAVTYLASGTMSWHGRCEVGAGCGLEGADDAGSPDRPQLLDTLLPDPAKLLADWQSFETIDLLNPQGSSTLTTSADAAKPPPFAALAEDFFPQGLVPADEAESSRLMPYRESTTMPAPVTHLSEAVEDAEEQEAPRTEPPTDPKIVEARLKRILQSYLQNGKANGGAGVDTMEFRPSDAKKGEFERIPF